jgi:SAM-dependent methyltransferase
MTRMLFKFFRQPTIDPLQVSMTGVKMGEKFVLVGCDDPVLLAGLGARAGLSGGAAAVLFDEDQAVLARRAAAREGFLLESSISRDGAVAFDDGAFDMGVVDDTRGGFANRAPELREKVLANVYRVLRRGGRIEIVEGLGGTGPFAKATVRPAGYDAVAALETAGYRPVRVLAEVTNFRFVEGLRV